MKVLLINGSPHQKGCTFTALEEVENALRGNGIENDLDWYKARRGLPRLREMRQRRPLRVQRYGQLDSRTAGGI